MTACTHSTTGRRVVGVLIAMVLVAAACADGQDGTAAEEATTTSQPDAGVSDTAPSDADQSDTAAEPDAEQSTTTTALEIPDYSAELANQPEAENDRSLPAVLPDSPIGAYGFSRYVFQRQGDDVVAALLEGPLGRQVRCQDVELQCSYQELKELYESGDEVPAHLEMDRETLGELVGQLTRVEAAVTRYDSLEEACADGLSTQGRQNANMGIHVVDPSAGLEFNPDKPQMILFAKDGGELLSREELGRCVDGSWTGEPGYVPVGAVFNIPVTDDHPEGFAGDIDNFHLHFNTCLAGAQQSAEEVQAVRATSTKEGCEARGGRFLPMIPTWMMHAYVAPDFEGQGGVFAMYNPSIWPIVEPESIREARTVGDDDAVAAPILNFDFGDIAVEPGQTVRFGNADSVPHTVTGVEGDFDSGLLSTGGTYDIEFDDAGQYELFCVLHPDMSATVVVE